MIDNHRPRLMPPKQPIDRLLDFCSLAVFVAMWVYVAYWYTKLLTTVPIHYSSNGQPDGYGHKAALFLLPSILSLVSGLLIIVRKYPHRFNYTVTITPENALYQYRLALRMLRYIQLVIVLLGFFLCAEFVKDAHRGSGTMPIWVIIVIEAFFILPVILYLMLSSRRKTAATGSPGV